MAARRGLRFEVIVGEEVTTRGGHLLALFIDERIQPLGLAPGDDRRDPRAGRPGDHGPPARPVSAVRPGLGRSAASSPIRIRASIPTGSRRSTRRRSGGRWHARVRPVRRRVRAGRGRRQRRARRRGRRHRLDHVRGPTAATTCAQAIEARTDRRPRQLPRHGQPVRRRSAARWASTAATSATRSAARSAATARVATSAIPAGALDRRATSPKPRRTRSGDEDRPRHAVHLPVAGRRQRSTSATSTRTSGCAATTCGSSAAATARSAPARATSSASATASRCRPTARSGRSRSRRATSASVDDMLERERFDVLHFHEPFVPFLSLVLLRESQSVNIATFHAYAGFSPAYEFGSARMQRLRRAASTAASRSARPRATSSTATSRATTRSSPTASTSIASQRRSRSRAGRTAR